jgi:hypothetical protein
MLTSVEYEEYEDTERTFRIRKSKNDRQRNGQKKKGQATIHKTNT